MTYILSAIFTIILLFFVTVSVLCIIKNKFITNALCGIGEDTNKMIFVFDTKGICRYKNKKVNEYLWGNNEDEFVSSCYLQWKNREENDKLQWIGVYGFGEDTVILDYDCKYITDRHGKTRGIIIFVVDRTREMSTMDDKFFAVTHDELTGVYRREYFFQRVKEILHEKPDERFYFLCTDISKFKLYNELFGEDRGDEVLFSQANLLRKTRGLLEVYGRISGDQFGMLISEKTFSEEPLIKYTKYLCDMFSSDLYRMHVVIGIYIIDDIQEPVSVMCDKAMLAINSVKGEYNKMFAYYDESMLEDSLYEQSIVGEFENALKTNQFCMYLQPQVDLGGKIKGCEALVRWEHPQKGTIAPNKFIGIFEKTGLIWKLDRFVWNQAGMQIRKWKDEGKNELPISVNISAKDFYYIDVYKEFIDIVSKYDIDPSMLKLEITESVLMEITPKQLELIQRLRKEGFEVEMDDFGSGYSSLSMLKEIDFDVLKLDMGFLRNTNGREKSWAIINGVLNMAKELNLMVITEGVETKEQVEKLSDLGCKMFQGFYFSKPVPVEEFETIND